MKKIIEELSKEIQELQIKITEYVRKNPIVFTRQSFEFTRNSQKTFEMIVDVLAEFEKYKNRSCRTYRCSRSCKL